MKFRISSAIAVIAFGAASASAEPARPHPSNQATANPAINSSGVKWDALAKGANSFTKTQAHDRLANAGYTKVTNLKKDKDGLWQGTAHWKGKKLRVAIDYKGNIASR